MKSGIKVAIITSVLALAATSVGANEATPKNKSTDAVSVSSALKNDSLMKGPVRLSSNAFKALDKSSRVNQIVMAVPKISMTRTASMGDEKRFVYSSSDMAKSRIYGEAKPRSAVMPNFYTVD